MSLAAPPSAPTAPGFPRVFKNLLRRSRRAPSLDMHRPVAALEQGMQKISEVFRCFGEDLPGMHDKGTALVDNCDKLLSLASGKSGGTNLFEESMHVLDQPLEHLNRSLQSLGPLLQEIEKCDQHSGSLLECQLEMGRTLAPLRHMIVFFKIEAAQLDPEHQTTFLTVADEIHRLRELIDETFDSNVARLQEARVTVKKIRQKVERDYAEHTDRIVAKRNEIESAISSMGDQLTRDTAKDTRVGEVSARINNHIGRLVGALQFEDILKQRLDHTVRIIRSGPDADMTAPWAQLSRRQIDDVLENLRQARNEIGESVERINAECQDLGEAAVRLRNMDSSTASIDGMVQLLLEAFEEIAEVTTDNARLAKDSYESLQPVHQVTENMSSVVGEVSLNIQLIALNAQVRSVQLGDGSGLEVLAARTAEISSELSVLGERITQEIGTMHGITEGLMSRLDEMCQTGENHISQLKSKGAGVINRLHHMRDETLATLQQVDHQLAGISDVSTGQTNRLTSLDQAENQLQLAAAWFDRHGPSRSLTAEEQSWLREHQPTYSMASERRVHAEISGDTDHLPEHDDSTTFFFDDEPADEPLPVPHEATAAGAAERRPTAPAPRANPAPPADLPDAPNVELF